MSLLPLLDVMLVAGLGLGVGMALVGRRTGRRLSDAGKPGHRRSGQDAEGVVRVEAEIRSGCEQTSISLIRELSLPLSTAGLGYGVLYLETQSDRRLIVRTRAENRRGFVGEITLAPHPGRTRMSYSLIRVPDDDDLLDVVLGFEGRLIRAVRRVSGSAVVRHADAIPIDTPSRSARLGTRRATERVDPPADLAIEQRRELDARLREHRLGPSRSRECRTDRGLPRRFVVHCDRAGIAAKPKEQ